MTAADFLLLIIGVFNLVLAFSIGLRDKKNPVHIFFSFFVGSLFLWAFLLAAFRTTQNTHLALMFLKGTYLAAISIAGTFYVFVHYFPSRVPFGVFQRWLLGISTFVLAVFLSLPGTLITGVRNNGIIRVGVQNPTGYWIFFVYFMACFFGSLIVLYQKRNSAILETRVHLNYILWSILSAGVLGVFFNLILPSPYIGEWRYVWIGPICTTIIVLALSYAIVKYKFLDIQPIIARAVSFLLVILLFAVLYAALVVFAVRQFIPLQLTVGTFVLLFAPILFGMLTFQPFERGIGKITDKLFFKGEYDRDALLAHLTRIMAETIDLELLTGRILNTLMKEMRISQSAILIIDGHKITDIEGKGFAERPLQAQELEFLFHYKDSGSLRSFIFEELEDNSELKNMFRRLDIMVAIPVRVEKTEVAVLVFGPKRTGERYHAHDLEFLEVFAAEAGIAIQNAKSFSEIKKFSKELEQRVLERTAELQKSQEQELTKAQEVARLKDEFVFLAAHELRTPVTVIKGFLELTSESKTKFPKDVRNNLTAIGQASEHLNQLINDLLEIARSESGTLTVNVEPREFEPIIREVLKEIAPLARQKRITVNAAIKPLPKVLCDTAKLKEVLLNLLGNALKYNKEGGAIEISAYRPPEEKFFVCEIRDTGYGIPQDRQARIFQKFFRAAAPGTLDVIGTGLGLFITRMLVEKMGGKIMFSSVEGEGSTFAFILPLATDTKNVLRAK